MFTQCSLVRVVHKTWRRPIGIRRVCRKMPSRPMSSGHISLNPSSKRREVYQKHRAFGARPRREGRTGRPDGFCLAVPRPPHEGTTHGRRRHVNDDAANSHFAETRNPRIWRTKFYATCRRLLRLHPNRPTKPPIETGRSRASRDCSTSTTRTPSGTRRLKPGPHVIAFGAKRWMRLTAMMPPTRSGRT